METSLSLAETWHQMSDFERTNWLATRIMGWHSDRKRVPGAEFVYWFDRLNPLMLIHEWQPAIVVEHSFMVACKLRDKGLYVEIVMRPNSHQHPSKRNWFCSVEDRVGCWYFEANGDDLAEAICECAWLAYGQEDE